MSDEVALSIQKLIEVSRISRLISRYCLLFDDQNWGELFELWTPDASFVVGEKRFDGRDALMNFLSNCLPPGYQSKHMISPPMIEISEDMHSASCKTDVVWISGEFKVVIVARYEDEVSCVADRWVFKQRTEVPMQFSLGPPPMSDAANSVSSSTMRKL